MAFLVSILYHYFPSRKFIPAESGIVSVNCYHLIDPQKDSLLEEIFNFSSPTCIDPGTDYSISCRLSGFNSLDNWFFLWLVFILNLIQVNGIFNTK